MRRFHSDEGREFKNTKVQKIFEEIGADQTFSNPYVPMQNGVSERGNRTVVNLARAILISAGLDSKRYLWAEAVNYCIDILNIITIHETLKISAHEIFFKSKPYLGKLQPFGVDCYVHNQDRNRRKFDWKSKPGKLVGYSENGLGYRIWIPNTMEVLRSKDVTFLKPSILEEKSNTLQAQHNTEQNKPDVESSVTITAEDHEKQVENPETERAPTPEKEARYNLRPRTVSKRVQRNVAEANVQEAVLKGEANSSSMSEVNAEEPASYCEAMKSQDKKFWQEAIQNELKSMHELCVWEFADLPPGRKAIDSKWVFKIKTNPQEQTRKYKARLVLRGFRQKEGEDYFSDKTFSPVARQEAIRTILSIAAAERLKLHQFDVKTAFLRAPLEEEIYMKQPEGCNDQTHRVLRLKKALYGLKQAPYAFCQKMKSILLDRGLTQSKTDSCIYYRNGKERMIVCIYVDDGIIASRDSENIDNFIKSLKRDLEITSQPLSYFLGVQIEINEDFDIHIHQTKYVEELLKRFDMEDSKPVSTPCDTGIYSLSNENTTCEFPYRELIGSLLYLATCTRFDIAFAVSYLARYFDKCTSEHWIAAKRILKYLKQNPSIGITYKSKLHEPTQVFSDSDFGNDNETRKSVSGVLVRRQGGAVIWSSTRQSNVAQSSCEAEFYSASEALKCLLWIKKLLTELEIQEKIAIQIDNQAAIKLIKNPQFYRRTKHIEIKYLFIRDHFEKGDIDVKFVPTDKQQADILTKATNKSVFLKLRNLTGLEKRQ